MKKSFLENKNYHQNNKFNAFNVIDMMLFIAVLSLFIISLGFCIKSLIVGKTDKNYTIFLIMHILAIIIILLPYIAKKIFKLHIPYFATSLYYLFLFLTSYLGTFMNLYQIVPVWDSIVHFTSGVMLGFVAMFFVNVVYKKQQKQNAIFVFVFVLVFALALGAMWEIFEFTCDSLLDINLQRYISPDGMAYVGQSAVVDTMLDIIMDFLGALISAFVCAICSHKNSNFVNCFKVTKIKSKQKISQIEE